MRIITNFKMCVMKLNKYFMMGAMGLSLVACSDNLDENGQSANGTNPNEGTTYVQVALKLDAGTSSRVGERPEEGDKDPGTEGEQAVTKVRIIITDESDNVEVNQLYTAATSSVDNNILGIVGFKYFAYKKVWLWSQIIISYFLVLTCLFNLKRLSQLNRTENMGYRNGCVATLKSFDINEILKNSNTLTFLLGLL